MDEAEAYLSRGQKIQQKYFGRSGCATTAASSSSHVVVVDVTAADRIPSLPMKRKKVEVGEAACAGLNHVLASDVEVRRELGLEKDMVMSPSAAAPPPRRISLIDKWFPQQSLQTKCLDAALSPSVEFVHATVQRMTTARDYVILLRGGVEDMETQILQATPGEKGQDKRIRSAEGRLLLNSTEVEEVVAAVGWESLEEVLAEFANEAPTSRRQVIHLMKRIMVRQRHLRTPAEWNLRRWHEFFDRYGPESGRVPQLSSLVWLSSASTTAMFTILVQRTLRGARATCSQNAEGDEHDVGRAPLQDNGPRFFDNTVDFGGDKSDDSDDAESAKHHCWLEQRRMAWSPSLTSEQRSLLAFLRFLMPCVSKERQSTGYGVWIYAAMAALDIPLDPDTDRLAHDLFRTCCSHVQTLATWKGISGTTQNALRGVLPAREDKGPGDYSCMGDVCREDLLALYSLLVVLAKFFRQNQDRLMPLDGEK